MRLHEKIGFSSTMFFIHYEYYEDEWERRAQLRAFYLIALLGDDVDGGAWSHAAWGSEISLGFHGCGGS